LGQVHPRFFQGDLLDPAYNLKTSAEYLANLLRYFGDDYVSVLAGYNWGWGNVIVARKDHGGEWLLRIPNETRRYVKRILFKE
jgi:soluble lytic murein transglycosylase-like protein